MHIVLICWDVLTKHFENHTLIAHGSGGWGVQEQGTAADLLSDDDPFSASEVV